MTLDSQGEVMIGKIKGGTLRVAKDREHKYTRTTRFRDSGCMLQTDEGRTFLFSSQEESVHIREMD